MSVSNQKVLEFGDGEYPFALNGKEVEELQKVCGYLNEKGQRVPIGFGSIWQAINLGTWSHEMIYNTIRLALEGGGMPAVEARRIANRYAVPPYRAGDPGGAEQTALAAVNGAMHGFEDLPPGEAKTPKA